jgi:hypothetical protein
MKTLLAIAILLGGCAACSNKPAATAAPPPATDSRSAASGADSKPAASGTPKPTPATARNANVTPVWWPTTNPGYVVLNQFDPPMQVPVSR